MFLAKQQNLLKLQEAEPQYDGPRLSGKGAPPSVAASYKYFEKLEKVLKNYEKIERSTWQLSSFIAH